MDVIVVYKVDRLTRSLADFAKLVETFDKHEVSFVSVTQSFNTNSAPEPNWRRLAIVLVLGVLGGVNALPLDVSGPDGKDGAAPGAR